jgi:hypothetical protein
MVLGVKRSGLLNQNLGEIKVGRQRTFVV